MNLGEQDQTLDDRGKVAVTRGFQRERILAKDFPLCGMNKLLLRARAEPVSIWQEKCSASTEHRRAYGKFSLTTGSIATNSANAAVSAGCASPQPFAKAPGSLPPAGEAGARAPNFTCSALASLSAAPRSYARTRCRRYFGARCRSADRQATLARVQGHEDHAGVDASVFKVTCAAGRVSADHCLPLHRMEMQSGLSLLLVVRQSRQRHD